MRSLFFVLFSIFSLPVFAASVSFAIEGQVTHVEPRYRLSVTYDEPRCWDERVPVASTSGRSYGGAVLGGVTGGVVGNQFGKGKGREAATALGAVIGALAGDNIDNSGYRSPSVQYRTERRCSSPMERRQNIPDGYDVTVRVQGQEVVFQMPDDPGYGTIRLRFDGNVTPSRW